MTVERIPLPILRMIEAKFMQTHAQAGTEDRCVINARADGTLIEVLWPEMVKARASVEGDLPLSFVREGHLWDLVFDLHSHHVMSIGANFSKTDDRHERIRGPVFGVCSWRDGTPAWKFRRWVGEFSELSYEEVVDSG